MNKRTIDSNERGILLLQSIGVAQQIQEEDAAVIESGKRIDAAVDNLRETLEQQGNDTLRVIDLLQLETVADDNKFTPEIAQIVLNVKGLRDNLGAIKALGIAAPTTYSEQNMLAYKLNLVGFNALKEFVRNWIYVIEHPEEAEGTSIDEVVEEAALDLMRVQLPIERFFDDKGIEYTEETKASMAVTYQEEYRDWLEQEYLLVMENIVTNPGRPYILKPIGIDMVKDTLKKFATSADDEYIDSLSSSDLYDGATFEELGRRGIVNASSREEITNCVSEFIDMNALTVLPGATPDSPGRPILNNINIQEIIAHAFILNSANLWNETTEGTELSENTKYMVDLMDVVIHETLPYGTTIDETTPMKALSLFSAVNQLMVSQNPIIRSNQRTYLAFCSSVGAAFAMIAKEKQENETKATEE